MLFKATIRSTMKFSNHNKTVMSFLPTGKAD